MIIPHCTINAPPIIFRLSKTVVSFYFFVSSSAIHYLLVNFNGHESYDKSIKAYSNSSTCLLVNLFTFQIP